MENQVNEKEKSVESPVLPNSARKLVHYKCTYCRKMCFSKEEVEQHEKTHTENKKLLCRQCNKGFARRSYLHEHMAIHKGIQAFQCHFCGKNFSLRCNLVRHQRIHTGEKPFKCHLCGQLFTLKKNMNEHVRTHTGEKPFVCPECKTGFARRSSLVRRALTHTNVRSYVCHDCGKKFSWKYYLKRHILTHMRPPKERAPRKRRTKAEIARDKALKSLSSTPSSSSSTLVVAIPQVNPNIANIKIEEDENTMTRVFLPNSTPSYNYADEETDADYFEEPEQEEPLKLTKTPPPSLLLPPPPSPQVVGRPFCVIVSPFSSRRFQPQIENEQEKETMFVPPVKVKLEPRD